MLCSKSWNGGRQRKGEHPTLLYQLLGMSKAVNAEDHTATICVEEEPAYSRCKTEYAQRERERGTKNMSIFIEMQQLQLRTTNLYKRLQKSLYIVTNLGQLPFMLFT